MIKEISQLFSRLIDAEYLHLLFETFPIYAILIGVILLPIARKLKDVRLRLVACLLIGVSALSVLPQVHSRKLAQPHMESMRSESVAKQIKEQTDRRAGWRWAFLVLAGLSLFSAFIKHQDSKLGTFLYWPTLAWGIFVFFLSLWLHGKDAETFHPNLKQGPGTSLASN